MYSRDSVYVADRYVSVTDPSAEYGTLCWFERTDITANTPTECMVCIQAEMEAYSKHAHPKAHDEAHTQATMIAEELAAKEDQRAHVDYYIFYYGREYRGIYNRLYNKYREEYHTALLHATKAHTDRVCQYHLESQSYLDA
jgi:hypothetical protein